MGTVLVCSLVVSCRVAWVQTVSFAPSLPLLKIIDTIINIFQLKSIHLFIHGLQGTRLLTGRIYYPKLCLAHELASFHEEVDFTNATAFVTDAQTMG